MTIYDRRDARHQTLASHGEPVQRDWPRAAFDAGLMLIVLLAGALLFDSSLGQSHPWPHPFWIPVIYVTVQYGTQCGVATAAVATALLLAVVQPERPASLDLYEYNLSLLLEPTLWLLSALTLGQISDRRAAETRELKQRLMISQEQREQIAAHGCKLQERLADVECVLAAGAIRSAEAALTASACLRSAAAGEIEPCLRKAAAGLLGPCVLSLHLLDEGQDRFLASHGIICGEADISTSQVNYVCSPSLVATVRARSDLVSILSDDDVPVREGFVFAAPLFEGEGLRGVLCLRDVVPDALHPWAEGAFALLASDLEHAMAFKPEVGLTEEAVITSRAGAA